MGVGTSFERDEIDGFDVVGLVGDSFIQAGDTWFEPTGARRLRRRSSSAVSTARRIYAHRYLSLLSTRLPEGVDIERGYDTCGWCCFESAGGQLIKPNAFCLDIGFFSVDKACQHCVGTPLRIGAKGQGAHC